ncbi:MAG: DMT family transporter, partial [Candidatus Heimdallarchaeota archaeon]|nr:DMT family transporter [Candidatus Heimdallarchaeota archaeon]
MRRRQGALLIAFGGIIWGSNGVIANLVSIHPLVIVFFRVFLAVIALGFFLLIRQRTDLLKLNQKGRSLIGLGLLLALTWSMLFAALQALPIGIAVLLNYLAPVLVAILAPIILKEQVTKQSVLGLSISLFGIILVSGITEGFLIFNISGIGFGLIAA